MPENQTIEKHTISGDVHLLGNLLGEVLREQFGESAFELVEQVRKTAIARRHDDPEAATKLAKIIQETSLDEKQILIRAFSNYFQLINIAEDQQRIRVIRSREAEGKLRESIHNAIELLHQSGKSATEMQELLETIRVRLVLTAHPSEAKRKEVLIKLQHIAELMTHRERQTLLEREEREINEQLGEEIEELIQTRSIPTAQKTVANEVDFGLYFIISVIMDVVVDIYEDLRYSLTQLYPDGDWRELPPVLRFASWIGGDRDGNPNVTTEVTMQTLQTLRATAQAVYLEEITFLREHITPSTEMFGVSEKLQKAIEQNTTEIKYPDELYRQYLEIIAQKLSANQYWSSANFLQDLTLIEDSLRENQATRMADGTLGRLIQKVKLFGLHITPLDIREDARLHAEALDELFERYGLCADYSKLSEEKKQRLLLPEIGNPRPLFPSDISIFSENTQRIIRTWQMVAEAHKQYSPVVIDSTIASMSVEASDVLAMLLLATEVGIQNDVDVVPLFETIDDLKNAPAVMTTLFEMNEYQKHLQARAINGKLRQQIMIGYSDSSKDGGYVASNWNLYSAQKELTDTCASQGVSLELFHGRGGSIGRGGGPTNRAILSQPPLSLQGGIKLTEQGEVIAYRYSNADIAHRHLHQVMNAMLVALGTPTKHNILPVWQTAMERLSEASRKVYRNFVYETDEFLDYWQATTPINELSQLRISSRPAKRKGSGGFAAMRAIPWVFSWMQSRVIVPSWFGAGSAFHQYAQDNEQGLDTLQEMYQEWDFFKALIENAQLDVAKADMGIAELYSTLSDDIPMREMMFGRIQREHQLTCEMITKITKQENLLDNTKALKLSIERRNPYVDPLNFIQVDLLRKLRQTDPDSPNNSEILNAVLATVNGIAAGMKTTG